MRPHGSLDKINISSTHGCLPSGQFSLWKFRGTWPVHPFSSLHWLDTSSIDERIPGNPASSDRAKSGWVVACTMNIYVFNRDMIYLSHSNNAVLSLGICSNLKYIHSISFNNIIGWFSIFSNIQVICFHPSYWFTKSNIFHYWEVIETLQIRGKD